MAPFAERAPTRLDRALAVVPAALDPDRPGGEVNVLPAECA